MKYTETARRLRECLDENSMKAQDLADLSGVSKASISQYLNGSHTPSNKTAGMMAPFFGVDPVWLIGFDVPKYKVDPASTPELTDREKSILSMYRYLDSDAKERIDNSIRIEYEQARKKDEDIKGA